MQRVLTQSTDGTTCVSVVIPVYNDSRRLLKCLTALEAQIYPPDSYEVIVVDNGSEESVEAAVRPFPHARTVLETVPGSYAARNRGIMMARGSVIAFTDSDTVPRPDWLANGVKALRTAIGSGLIAGRISIFFRDEQRPTAVELYESLFAFPQEEFVGRSKFGATANMFTYKKVLDRVGFFNPAMKSSGDREWCQRVSQSGYQVRYSEDACVAHPARYNLREIHRQSLRVEAGLRDLRRLRGRLSLWRDAVSIAWDLLPPFRRIYRVCFSPKLKGPAQRFKVAVVATVIRYIRAWARFRSLFLAPGQVRG
jgi:cellulose synthase/poly-beta-1,6-N-acetylglucosamine synthase-like glycosyltransferase